MVQGHLRSDAERYGALRLTPKSRSLLKGEERIRLRQEVSSKRVAKVARAPSYQIASEDEPLWEALRELRTTLCREAGVPPYVIFHDATLREMVRLRPSSPSELLTLQGIGDKKLERYGVAFLDVLREHGALGKYEARPSPGERATEVAGTAQTNSLD